jgi:hypothetical protein
MVCSFFGIAALQQCEIAGQFLRMSGCCPPGNNPSCNLTLPEAAIPGLYSSVALVAATVVIGDTPFQLLLANGSLVLVLLAFPATYHFVMLSGYDATSLSYTTHDPKYSSPFSADYSALSSAYHSGGAIAQAWRVSAT